MARMRVRPEVTSNSVAQAIVKLRIRSEGDMIVQLDFYTVGKSTDAMKISVT